ncbi:MAG: uncharacterized protein KVP18_002857 [Porospora cf. gigantea A]|uniref:uncharacterized protein n=1 Tax=Porospora cf. gigantea A TaxID=2853593 RepID=UPI00355A18B0|nr:MAG: hypothetical protein KVP18_002857 [Porospora cf. gigantea A]
MRLFWILVCVAGAADILTPLLVGDLPRADTLRLSDTSGPFDCMMCNELDPVAKADAAESCCSAALNLKASTPGPCNFNRSLEFDPQCVPAFSCESMSRISCRRNRYTFDVYNFRDPNAYSPCKWDYTRKTCITNPDAEAQRQWKLHKKDFKSLLMTVLPTYPPAKDGANWSPRRMARQLTRNLRDLLSAASARR